MLPPKLSRHLEENNISYFDHFKRAFKISLLMAAGSIFCTIHAILPFIFETAATDIAHKISKYNSSS
tara:strand:+ start:623 stop:823 length:201 start_codon:yes stop_codon:yes gene_type:complete